MKKDIKEKIIKIIKDEINYKRLLKTQGETIHNYIMEETALALEKILNIIRRTK